MAREHDLPDAYRGATGATRSDRVHYSCRCGAVHSVEVFRAVNATDDPALAKRLRSPDPARGLNTAMCPKESAPQPVDIPVVYHEPSVQLFVLVLPVSYRHRELHERAALLTALAEDRSAAVPSYVIGFSVVYGPVGLEKLLEERAQSTLEQGRVDRESGHIRARAAELDRVAARIDQDSRALAERQLALEGRQAALEGRQAALDRRSEELERTSQDLAVAQAELRVERARARAAAQLVERGPSRVPASRDAAEPATDPYSLVEPGDPEVLEAHEIEAHEIEADEPEVEIVTSREDDDVDSALDRALRPAEPGERVEAHPDTGEIEMVAEPADDSEVIVADQFALGAATSNRSHTDSGSTRVGGRHDVEVERWIHSREEWLVRLDDSGAVRLAAAVRARQLDDLLGDNLQLRLQLHRLPTYPLLTLSVGTTPAFAGDIGVDPFCFHIDIAFDAQRAVVEALSREFTFVLELYDTEYVPVRRRTVSAAFADNARVALAAALDHLSGIPPHDRSFAKAVLAHSAPGYDRFARQHPERREFRDDRLQHLDTPAHVLGALHMTRRFSTAVNEDYLVFLRGYPLGLWQQRRRAVLERAVEGGLWLGPELANIAVSEGIARSRRDLAKALQRNFAHLVSEPVQHDLSEQAVRDNWAALREEMTALGLGPDEGVKPRTEPIDSEVSEVASGTIGRVSQLVPKEALDAAPAAAASNGSGGHEARRSESLVLLLDNKDTRLTAALELAERGDPRALGPMFESIKRMTRGEAGRALGAVVKLGKPAVPYLLQTLHSRKGYLRQGAALALAVLKDEEGIEAICDLLVGEPTEIWREIARAIGEVGPSAVMSLAARLANQSAEVRERAAWALAHVAARGGVQPIEQLSRGRDPVAAGVARHALELANLARSDDIAVRGRRAPRDQTVNRAFSRRFFEALEGGVREPVPGEAGSDLSGPAMVLDEADLIEAEDLDDLDDPGEALDESDLIPT